MNTDRRQTRTQRMARLALECVKPVASGPLASGYKPRAMGFPVQVLQSGLAQAIGFLAAKGGDTNDKAKAYKQYLDDVARVAGRQNGTALMEDALAADLDNYRLLTRDVLDAAAWLKRFTQTLLKNENTGAGHDS